MAKCWELRGCSEDVELMNRCPHNEEGCKCPADCHMANCERPTHKVTTNIDLLFRTDLDRSIVKKAACEFCEFFLTYGPVLTSEQQEAIKAQPHEVRRAARERKVGSADFLGESYQITKLEDF